MRNMVGDRLTGIDQGKVIASSSRIRTLIKFCSSGTTELCIIRVKLVCVGNREIGLSPGNRKIGNTSWYGYNVRLKTGFE